MFKKIFEVLMLKSTISISLLLVAALVLSIPATAQSFPEFTKLVENASPAVVNITATRKPSINPQLEGYNREDVPEFFRRFFENQPERRQPRPAAGSGFIISSDGYILTNNHVVEDADEIIVALSDRRERVAVLIGADPASDLALLKIDATDLPSIALGNSEKLKVGEWVIAIGSPFGFELSVTAGIVSAKGRSLPAENGNYVPFIQTDVAINPGNSGGPLLDLEGKVVGINSQIFTRSGGFMGLSFAIPIDVAMEVVEQLKEKGSVSRGWLGVLIQRVDRDLAESFGLDRATGALITQVLDDSPAEKGGLKEGDIILKFNGRDIDLSSDLPHIVGRTKAESTVGVEIVRNGKMETVEVMIGLLPGREERIGRATGARSENSWGIVIEDIPSQMREQLSVDHGVIVSRVIPGPAQEAGLRRGDVITNIDGDKILDSGIFSSKLGGLTVNVPVPVRVIRNGTPEFLAIKIIE
ncbi:MAG: serine protease Do [Candidatus Azotimanducaceae bacterium]